MNYQKHSNNTFGYKQIAKWEKGVLTMENGDIQWKTRNNVAPASLCSEPCLKGYAKVGQSSFIKQALQLLLFVGVMMSQ